MNRITLLDGAIERGLRITHTVVAEACLSDPLLRRTTIVQRGVDYCCRVGESTDVVIRFVDRGAATHITVDVVEVRPSGFARLRRRRTPAAAMAIVDTVEQAIDSLDGAAQRMADALAA